MSGGQHGDVAAAGAAGRRMRALFQVELIFVIICWMLALVAALAWFFRAPFGLVISLGVLGAVSGIGAFVTSRRMKPLYAAADENLEHARERIRHTEENLKSLELLLAELKAREGAAMEGAVAAPAGAAQAESGRLPCAVGFANLGGAAWRATAEADAARLAPLFAHSRLIDGHVTVAGALFVYADLREDGTLAGTDGAGIRQIVELTGARLVVLASPNPAERVQRAVALPGPKTANLVFTLDRGGEGFVRFFAALFDRMRGGSDLPAAWAALEPRLALAAPGDTPQMLLLAEADGAGFSA